MNRIGAFRFEDRSVMWSISVEQPDISIKATAARMRALVALVLRVLEAMPLRADCEGDDISITCPYEKVLQRPEITLLFESGLTQISGSLRGHLVLHFEVD